MYAVYFISNGDPTIVNGPGDYIAIGENDQTIHVGCQAIFGTRAAAEKWKKAQFNTDIYKIGKAIVRIGIEVPVTTVTVEFKEAR
jgi:hypothetical protein